MNDNPNDKGTGLLQAPKGARHQGAAAGLVEHLSRVRLSQMVA